MAYPFACMLGNLEGVQRWMQDVHMDIQYIEDGLRVACEHGHLAVAQLLGGVSGVDVHADDEEAFKGACFNGHLHVAKWLVALGGVDIHAEEDHAFSFACIRQHAETARWLISLQPHWPWPDFADVRRTLQTWSVSRDAWMRAVVAWTP